ncbi:MAG: DegT/DnrJ/EryC1/StrS family aminotransferase [Cyclobacteriaceae bacterium]|nr:DegT/DnrJ/EryC1/StrS family aminotransferase [Cyclobacteriaceae bacterium]
MNQKIPYYSLDKMHQDLQDEMKDIFQRVLKDSWFVLGNHLEKFETEFALYIGVKYAIGVGNGLDGLKIALRSLALEPGKKIIIPAMTFSASVLAALENGIQPLLVDVDAGNCLISMDELRNSITPDVKAVMPVHLYGNPCDMEKINQLAGAAEIYVIEDFAQSAGASFQGKYTGSFGKINATSFYPVKPLGALGDGGMITTNDPALRDKCLKLRNYGYNGKYTMELMGYNSRLDEIQAALLGLKLKYLETWKMEREKIARRYLQNLSGNEKIILPFQEENRSSAFHIFPVRVQKRDELRNFLEDQKIQTQIHYPVPPHLQPGMKFLGYKKGDFPVTEKICDTELSLPVYPGLSVADVDRISEYIHDFLRRNS